MKRLLLACIVILPAIVFCQTMKTVPVGGSQLHINAPVVTDSTGRVIHATNEILVNKPEANTYHVQVNINSEEPYYAGNIDVKLAVPVATATEMQKLKRAFHWVPNIKNAPGQIISQHVFRSPCMILTLQKAAVIFVPDLRDTGTTSAAPYYFDLNYGDKEISINFGLSNYDVIRHQYYKKNNVAFAVDGPIVLSFYILVTPDADALTTLKTANDFLWQTYARQYISSPLPQTVSFGRYADVGYTMAMDHYWVDAGKQQGGITLSTFFDKENDVYRGRFYRNDIWYHSWFNNMRTAYGLYYWGKQSGNDGWQQKAMASANLLMSSPKNNGWFSTVFLSEENKWIGSGQGGAAGLYHLPDNSWSAYWLMRFNDELRKIDGADKFLLDFAAALLKVQNKDGSFPARIKVTDLTADSVLHHTSSGAAASWYLTEMMLAGKIPAAELPKYRKAVERSLAFLQEKVLPEQRFDDFELYFSCSRKPINFYDSTTAMYGQNTLAIQWCAEAYLKAYRLFRNKRYLRNAEYCVNILSLYQQVWNPAFISLYAFGGFGVMNTDAEWSDARQAQFAETYLNFYNITGKEEYKQRGIAACRAAFALMVLPENKHVAPKNYQGTKFNGESFPGTMAENYGHDGYDKRSFQSGFHWGTGSALTTAAVLHKKWGAEIDIP